MNNKLSTAESRFNRTAKQSPPHEKLPGQGFEVRTSSPQQLATYISNEIRQWAPIARQLE